MLIQFASEWQLSELSAHSSTSIDDRKFVNYSRIDLVTVFDAILTSRQKREKLQCFYENLMSDNFRKIAVLKKISTAD